MTRVKTPPTRSRFVGGDSPAKAASAPQSWQHQKQLAAMLTVALGGVVSPSPDRDQ